MTGPLPSTNKPRPRILVIRGGAIGDFILTLPVLSALRAQFPGTDLHLLGYPRVAGLARAGGLVEEVASIEARTLAPFFAAGASLDPDMENYFKSFAVIISYLYDPDHIFQTNVRLCSAAQFIAGGHRPREDHPLHATEFFLQPLEQLAIYGTDPAPHLFLPRITGKRDNNNVIAIHPGSGSERKNWPEPHWKEFLELAMVRTLFNFLIIGGEAEIGLAARISSRLPAGRVRIVENLALPDLAQQLAACWGFIGHDSGITHLAVALGVEALVLWGETNAQVWAPRGYARLVRDDGGLARLPVARVLDEIRWFSESPRIAQREASSGETPREVPHQP